MRHLCTWAYAAVVAFLFVHLPNVGGPTSLDCSWQGLLQHDWNNDVRAGVGSVFTYGPMGFMVTAWMLFTAEGVWQRFVAAIVQALVLATAFTAFSYLLRDRIWRIGWFLVVPVLALVGYGADVFAGIAVLGVLLLRLQTAADPPPLLRLARWPLSVAILVLLAFAGMTKFTYFVLTIVEVGVVAGVAVLQRRIGAGAAIAVAHVVVFAVLWMSIGQSLGDIAAWLHGSSEIAKGYNEAMAIYGAHDELWSAAAMLGLSGVLAVVALANRGMSLRRPLARERLPDVGTAAIAVCGAFLCWKAGFVRHDSAHTLVYFAYVAAVPFLLASMAGRSPAAPVDAAADGADTDPGLAPVVAPVRPGPGARVVAALGGALAVSAVGMQLVCCDRTGAGWPAVRNALRMSTNVFAPTSYLDGLRQRIDRNARQVALPELRARIGEQPTDIMGHEQGLLFAGGFPTRHRPVFQSYSAYTPYLQELNAAFFRGPEAPRLVLAKVQSSDGRLAMTEDSRAWLELFDNYYPATSEAGITLLERRERAAPIERTTRIDRRAALGEWVDLGAGDDWLELAVDADFSLRGRLMGFLFRPAPLLMDVRVDDGSEREVRISPLLVRAPFLLSPLVTSQQALVRAYVGAKTERVRAIRVRAQPGKEGEYRPDVGVRVFARPAPWPAATPAEAERLADVGLPMIFEGFGFRPTSAQPRQNLGDYAGDGVKGVVAHAPCDLLFRWPGGAHRLSAGFLLPAASYTGDNHSDGVEYRVEVGGEGQRRVVFSRLLQPATVEGDRGLQRLSLPLDLPAGEQLVLRTLPGPANHSGWDWSVWAGVRLE